MFGLVLYNRVEYSFQFFLYLMQNQLTKNIYYCSDTHVNREKKQQSSDVFFVIWRRASYYKGLMIFL